MEWANTWGMAFNVDKCKVMHMGRSNKRYLYTMGGKPLKTTEEEKDIGVIITSNLKPSTQCASAAKKRPSSTQPDNQGFSLPPQTCICQTVPAIRSPPSRVCDTGVVAVDRDGQADTGARPGEGGENDIRPKFQHL